jgi:hypothetical protein
MVVSVRSVAFVVVPLDRDVLVVTCRRFQRNALRPRAMSTAPDKGRASFELLDG